VVAKNGASLPRRLGFSTTLFGESVRHFCVPAKSRAFAHALSIYGIDGTRGLRRLAARDDDAARE
jgi:hypothetical protein